MFGRNNAAKAVQQWQAQRDAYAEYLHIAQTLRGTGDSGLMLASGEYVFLKVAGAALIEERRTRGHYQGRYSGVSIPVGFGVRYRTGGSRGHYVQGAAVPTAIDTGTVYITDKRVIFQGTRQTRECAFAKLIGFQHDDSGGSTTFSVSNRQKPTTIHYGSHLSAVFDFRLDLALSHFKGTVGDLIGQLQRDLARIEAARPAAAEPTRRDPQSIVQLADRSIPDPAGALAPAEETALPHDQPPRAGTVPASGEAEIQRPAMPQPRIDDPRRRPPRPASSWPKWTLIGSGAGVIVSLALAAIAGKQTGGAVNDVGATLLFLSLLGLVIAGPVALWRWREGKRAMRTSAPRAD